jgi:hypothetical protein
MCPACNFMDYLILSLNGNLVRVARLPDFPPLPLKWRDSRRNGGYAIASQIIDVANVFP